MNAAEIKKTTEGRTLTGEEFTRLISEMDDGVLISVQVGNRETDNDE